MVPNGCTYKTWIHRGKTFDNIDEVPQEETQTELYCVNVNDIHDTRWVSEKDFKEAMHVRIGYERKLKSLKSQIETLRAMIK